MREGNIRFIEYTLEILSIISTTEPPSICTRRVDEFVRRNHKSDVYHHICFMRYRHFLEENNISCYCLGKRYDMCSIGKKHFRKISYISYRKYESTRSGEEPPHCRDTICDTWSILRFCSSHIRGREDFLDSKIESIEIK